MMKPVRTSRNIAVIGAFVAAILLLALLFISGRAQVTTDLFVLLPVEERDPVLQTAMNNSQQAFFKEITVVVTAPTERRREAAAAARDVVNALQQTPVQLRDTANQADDLQAAYRSFPFRWLTPADRDALVAQPERLLRQEIGVNLARPGGYDPADPGGLLARFVTSLPGGSASWTLLEGLPAHINGNEVRIVINGELTASPLDAAVQSALDRALGEAADALANACAECRLDWTGAVRFSQAARETAQRDISRLTTVALIGITLLFLLMFRSLRPLAGGVVVLTAGVVSGLCAVFAVFGQVHVLTLVFGTTLLGLCIDYVVHLLVHRWAHPASDGRQALRAVAPGLKLGLLTSVVAFLFLLFAGFPALSQIAVFSLAGLIAAWMMVSFWLREAIAPPQQHTAAPRFSRPLAAFPAEIRLIVLLALLLAAATGLPQISIVDDVRGLQAIPAELGIADRHVRAVQKDLQGDSAGPDFLLIEAADLDTALMREAEVLSRLNAAGAIGLSQFLPGKSVQENNLAAFAPLFAGEQPLLRQILTEFNFRAETYESLAAEFAASSDAENVTESMLAMPGFRDLAHFRIETKNGIALLAYVPADISLPVELEGVRLVRPLEQVESTFATIRQRTVFAVTAAYLLMLLVLARRYGLLGGLRALAPAIFGATVALGMLGVAGLPLNVFSLVALILVLGIGADYALFLREGKQYAQTVRLATTLAAATSLLSFGLLLISSLPALQAFGFAASVGILTAWLAAPLAVPGAVSGTRWRRPVPATGDGA